MVNTCAICGAPTDNKVVCGRKCAGHLGGSPRKPIQEKVAKLGKSGYWYYTHTMLDENERSLFSGNIILVHRYIMTMHIGRALGRNEVVMHINGDKNDNRIEISRLVQLSKIHGSTMGQ